jgi:hypothetical protein
MIEQGYSRSQFDDYDYFKKFSIGSFINLLLYVDDILNPSQDKLLIRELKTQLNNKFDKKKLGAAKNIHGMEIHMDRQVGKLFLSRKKYIDKVLERFNMSNCKPLSTPLVVHFKLSSNLCPTLMKRKNTCLTFLILVQLVALCMQWCAIELI